MKHDQLLNGAASRPEAINEPDARGPRRVSAGDLLTNDCRLLTRTEASLILGVDVKRVARIRSIWFVPDGLTRERTTLALIRMWQQQQQAQAPICAERG